jgi:hypothetical protein
MRRVAKAARRIHCAYLHAFPVRGGTRKRSERERMAKETDMQPLHSSSSPSWAMVLLFCSASATAADSGPISARPAAIDGISQATSPDSGHPWGTARLQITPVPSGQFGQALDPRALADLRGGYDSAENSIVVDGTVGGNTANGVIAGANTISDGAFAHANGLSTVIQNSGSNVLIQNAMIVKLDFGGGNP